MRRFIVVYSNRCFYVRTSVCLLASIVLYWLGEGGGEATKKKVSVINSTYGRGGNQRLE